MRKIGLKKGKDVFKSCFSVSVPKTDYQKRETLRLNKISCNLPTLKMPAKEMLWTLAVA